MLLKKFCLALPSMYPQQMGLIWHITFEKSQPKFLPSYPCMVGLKNNTTFLAILGVFWSPIWLPKILSNVLKDSGKLPSVIPTMFHTRKYVDLPTQIPHLSKKRKECFLPSLEL